MSGKQQDKTVFGMPVSNPKIPQQPGSSDLSKPMAPT
jgi:hypothetical protein